ncbi:MAG: amidohydrolase family protein [Actinobacteria bacterium]|nr:amidohydrolase family protein [Actinomycetota bacterium]
MHDLIVTGGLVIDGTGRAGRHADVAISGGIITEVAPAGSLVGTAARQRIDATGLVVTPGFVDVHTHFDGQVTWDETLSPTCWHGVTTVVMGNCGVGFAPVRPDRHDWLIGLMEGVEDIPGAALSDGIVWEWETYPEFLDAVGRKKLALDVGSLIPHGAVRAYVMGDRGAHNEPAETDDIAAMAAIVRQAMMAGALGFSTSRTIAHMAIDGEPVPGTFAAEAELFGIGEALAEVGSGVFELAPAGTLGEDLAAPEREMDWMRRLGAATGRPIVFAMTQNDHDPDAWRTMLDLSAKAAADGAAVHPQVAARPINLLLGLQTFHPFSYCPSWGPLGFESIEARLAAMADPTFRDTLLREVTDVDEAMLQFVDPARVYPMAHEPNYEPAASDSIAAQAERLGQTPMERYYDVLQQDDGKQLIMRPLLNFSNNTLDPVKEMLEHPTTVWGLGDGGAHCGTTCDASSSTFMVTHWSRDRAGDRLPLEFVVKKMTSDTARMFGLGDRGIIAPGYLGDLNVIEYTALALERPYMIDDLPAGAKRFIQRARGYVATVKRGAVTFRNGEDQGVRPGGLVRGAR